MSIDKKGFRFRLNNVLSWAALGGVAITLIVFGYLGKLFVVTGVIGSLWVATIFLSKRTGKGLCSSVFVSLCVHS
jgi:hypothetical protein